MYKNKDILEELKILKEDLMAMTTAGMMDTQPILPVGVVSLTKNDKKLRKKKKKCK